MSRAQSYMPERIELPGGEEVWITPALASRGFAEWYESLPEAERPDPNPPLPAEALFAMMAAGVTAWSLTDAEGQRIEVNWDSVSALSWDLGKPIAEWCNTLVVDVLRDLYGDTRRALEGQS